MEGGLTPLIIASYAGRLEVVKALLAAKADPNIANNDKEPPLMTVAASDKADLIVPLLVGAGAQIEVRDKWQRTPLIVFAHAGRTGSVAYLLKRGARADVTDSDGQTPLFNAALNGHAPTLKLLLADRRARAVIDKANKFGASPLLVASAKGHLPVVVALLGAGANRALKAKDDTTAMGAAVASGHIPVAEALRKAGTRLDGPAGPQGGALHVAVAAGVLASVKWAIAKSADVNALVGKMRPIHWAAATGNVAIATVLLDAGAQVGSLSSNGTTPLLLACYGGQLPLARLLISKGATMKANPQGGTPLRSAAAQGHLEVVRFLLTKGADRKKRDSYGQLAIDYARENGHKKIVALLER